MLFGKDVARPEVVRSQRAPGAAAARREPRPLSPERDEQGMNRVRVDWRLGEAEKQSLRRTLAVLGEDLAVAGIGSVRSRVGTEDELQRGLRFGHHHIGTTRMHADPAHGVVDADCRVHGIDNLYVAGSSVFPTSGASTVTLTLVALAIRLADHLKSRLSQPAMEV